MKREDLLAKGYTEEQVTDLLNTFHEVNNENKKLQSELDKKASLETQNQELQKQLDEIHKANMTEQEKINAEKRFTILQKQKKFLLEWILMRN